MWGSRIHTIKNGILKLRRKLCKAGQNLYKTKATEGRGADDEYMRQTVIKKNQPVMREMYFACDPAHFSKYYISNIA